MTQTNLRGRAKPFIRAHRGLGSWLLLSVLTMAPQAAAAPSSPQKPSEEARTLQLLQTAHSFFAQGDYENARKYYLQTLPAYSHDFEVLQRIGYCYFVMGRPGYAQAARYYDQAYKINPHSREVADKLATCLSGLKRPEEAARILTQLAEMPDAPVDAWKRLAEAYQQAGQFTSAVSAYDAYLQRKSGDLAARTNFGNLYTQQKDYPKALEQFRLVLSASPDYSPALIGMGHVLAWQGQFEESLKTYDRALRLRPQNGEALTGKAFVLLWMNRPEEAASLFQKLRSRFPNDVDAARGLASAQTVIQEKLLTEARRSGNIGQVEAYYQKRLEKDPKDLESLKKLASLTASQPHCSESIGYDRRALEVAPRDVLIELALARALALCQQYMEAISRYRRYLEARHDAQDALFELGQLQMREREIADATQTFRSLLAVNPKNPDGLLGLAESLAASRNYTEALARYDEVLKISPNNYDALQGKAFVLFWTDQFQEARAIFQNLAQQRPSDPQNTLALQDIAEAEEAAHWVSLRPPAGAPPKDFEAYYRQRLASYPQDLSAMKALGYVQGEEKDYEAALRTYKEVLQMKPDDSDAKAAMERVTRYLEYNSVSHARTLAYNGGSDRVEGLRILKEHLEHYPDDNESRILYGTVLSWEGRYDEAREELQKVLAKNPTHADALPALINVELWSDHPERAAGLAREGSRKDPTNVAYLLDEAHALRNMGRDRDALKLYKRAESLQPNNADVKRSVWSFRKWSGDYWEFKVDHTFEFFNKIFGGQHETTFSARGPTPFGSVTLRESRADRFSSTSYLSEIDFWPSFRPGTYGYVNVGYSDDAALYPRTRLGLDLYQDYHGYEFSGGYRHLHFASNVNIYTFALSKYHGKWFFTERTFLTPGNLGLSNTEVFSVRRFFGDEGLHDYFEVFFSRGASPAQARTTLNLQVLDSYRSGITLDKAIGHFSVDLKAAMGREQQTYASNIRRYTLEGQIYYRF